MELDSASYSYDLAGNRTNKTRNGILVDYELGDGNRLSSWDVSGAPTPALILVSGSSTETIGLDPRFGERLINDTEAEASGTNFWHSSVPVTAGSVDLVASMGDGAGNLGYATNSITVTIITNAAYGYDNAGNLTNVSFNSDSRTLGLSWNQQYQLTSISTNSTAAESYTYDALGRRLTTTTGSDTILQVYDGIHCIADVDTNGAPVRTYVYGPGIDNPLAMTVHGATTNTYYYLTDHLGSVMALTDDSGSIVESYSYDAYGRARVFGADGTPLTESALGNRFAFQGRECSWTTGLICFRARWYDPITGRWLSKDPIGISGGLNQYVAFGGNGVMYRDPTGLDVWIEKASGSEPDLHISVNVGDPNGEYLSQSFGTDLKIAPLGFVYEDVEKGGKISRYAIATPEQDEQIKAFLRDQRRLLPTEFYGPNTCRTYTKETYRQIIDDFDLHEIKPPRRKKASRAWWRRLFSVSSSPTQSASSTTSSSNSGPSQ